MRCDVLSCPAEGHFRSLQTQPLRTRELGKRGDQKAAAAGPEVGACGGCEFGYGKELSADYVAWIVVQKVSDLILNINVYMADVAAGKLAFVHSVDIRGDTDESWTRGITYLVKNYLLAGP